MEPPATDSAWLRKGLAMGDTCKNIYKVGAECHVNLHQMRMITTKSMAANGAYCRKRAWKLMLRAAFRYLSDSVRSELDKCDIPRNERFGYLHNVWDTPEKPTVK